MEETRTDMNEALKLTIIQSFEDEIKGRFMAVKAGEETTEEAYSIYMGYANLVEFFTEKLHDNASDIINPRICDNIETMAQEVWLKHSELVR